MFLFVSFWILVGFMFLLLHAAYYSSAVQYFEDVCETLDSSFYFPCNNVK
jgi:hypothetical protein